MNIWIDGFEANVPQRLGSGQVAFELLRNLEKIDKKNSYTILLASDPLFDLPAEREGWEYKILKIKKFKTYIGIPWELYSSKQKPDVIFSPTHYGPIFSPVKRVIMIFDLAFLKFKNMFKPRDLYQLTLWTKISIKKAAKIITISNYTKKDIQSIYGINKEKIVLAYPGYDSEIFKPINNRQKIEEVKQKYKISKNYIIYIGTIQPRKNLPRLIEAFSRVVKSIPDLQLVIVGKTTGLGRQGWMFEETLQAPKRFDIEDKVIFTGFASSEDLPYLINGAVAFVQPSLYEGFGIPVVEAMACGVPVLTSKSSSLPEVVGSAGLTFDPESVTQIEQAIRVISTDKKLREKLVKLSLKQAKKFSWQKMAKETLRVLENV